MNLRRTAGLAGAVLALAFLAAAAARADDDDFDWTPRGMMSVGARGTYSWNKSDIDSGKTYGGGQIRAYAWILGLEISSDYRRIQLPHQTEINVFPVHGDVLVYLLPWRLTPYAIVGGSWITSARLAGNEGSAANREGFEAGGGLEWRWDSSWSLDGEYRYLWLTGRVPDSNASTGPTLMASLNYHFEL
jgi:opacity protein-like surface antigen